MCCCSKSNQDMKDPVDGTTVVPTTQQPVTDPVCGMTVDPANAGSVEYDGTRFYFCCQGCALRFQAEPAKYLQAKQDIPLVQVAQEGGTDGRLYLSHAPGSA
jgi:YHS domain-containing protein